MAVSQNSIRAGLNYITARLDHSGEAYVLDVGRDVIHSEPIMFATWGSEASDQEGSFIETLFDPEHMERNYSPSENIRVAYDDEFRPSETSYTGSWRDVDFYDIGETDRNMFRERKESAYWPDDEALDQLYDLIS